MSVQYAFLQHFLACSKYIHFLLWHHPAKQLKCVNKALKSFTERFTLHLLWFLVNCFPLYVFNKQNE